MATETITDTERVLAEMLTENTGVALCDSGGAYGRHWERNRGRTVGSYLEEPPATLNEGGPVFSTFQYLRHQLEYAPEVDARFQAFLDAPEREEETYFSCVYEWCEEHEDAYQWSFLTYNMEEECLGQGFQADTFRYEGDDYACISIHGGCDIRGGYTRPRVFRVVSDMFGGDLGSYTLYSEDRRGEDVVLDISSGEVVDREGQYLGGDDPLYKWACFWQLGDEEGYPKWDKERERWVAPDGDGYIDIEPDFVWNS